MNLVGGHPIGRWFTEGFDTADLEDAKALLVSWREWRFLLGHRVMIGAKAGPEWH